MPNKETLNILIRCDASTKIGLGHVTRCLVLAKKLRQMNYQVYFAMKNYALGISLVRQENFNIDIASENNFAYDHWLQSCCIRYNTHIFIADVRDNLPINSIKKIKQKKILTIAIDEPSEYRKACDLCFYPPIESVNKLDWEGFLGKRYQGLEYVILRDEFYKQKSVPKYHKFDLLIMMGGTDAKELTLSVISNLVLKNKNMAMTAVVHTSHTDYQMIKKNYPLIKLISNVNNMAQLMSQMDYAIVSYGISAYELLALQIPATHICLNQDHLSSSHFFQSKGYAKTIDKKQLVDTIELIDLSIKIKEKFLSYCQVIPTILREFNDRE